MQKIRKLAEYNSPIVLRGFKKTTDLPLFTAKAREMGDVMPWKFGEVLVVKDAGNEGGGLNNVLSAEPMPFHFDGLFKTTIVKDQNGEDKVVPQPPKYVHTAQVQNMLLTKMQISVVHSRNPLTKSLWPDTHRLLPPPLLPPPQTLHPRGPPKSHVDRLNNRLRQRRDPSSSTRRASPHPLNTLHPLPRALANI